MAKSNSSYSEENWKGCSMSNSSPLSERGFEMSQCLYPESIFHRTLFSEYFNASGSGPSEVGGYSATYEESENRRHTELIKTLHDQFTERLDVVEQKLTGKNIRIYGVAQLPDEDLEMIVVNIFRKILSMNIGLRAIEKCFRTGEMSPGVITVTFSSYDKKKEVMKRIGLLKNTGIEIREDLCPGIEKLLEDVANEFGEKNVRYKNGIIMATLPGRSPLVFRDRNDFRMYMNTDFAHNY